MSTSSNGHVLIIDDDPSINRMFQLLLKDAGYRVSTAATSEEAMKFIKIIVPDVILLDISLPGMDGVALTRQIKSEFSQFFIPIILITALGDMKTKVTALDAGGDDFLVKPVEFSELLARVRVMMRLQQSRRSLQETSQRLEVLLNISQTLTTSLDINYVLGEMVHQLAKALNATRASIVMTNSFGQPFYASSTHDDLDPDTMNKILSDGVAGWVMRSMKPLTIPDARHDHRWLAMAGNDTTRSVLAVPLIHNQTALGVITAIHVRTNYFTNEHLELMESVAAQSVIAFDHAYLFQITNQQKQQLERRSHILEEMVNVSDRLRLNLPLPALLSEIADTIRRAFGFRQVVIQLFETSENEAVQGSSAQPNTGSGLVWTAQTVEVKVLPLMRGEFRVSRSYYMGGPGSLPEGLSGHLFVPIGVQPSLSGVVIVAPQQSDRAPDVTTVQALEVFANQVANAVQNNLLFAQERSRANQLQLLVDVGRNLTELMTPDQLFRLVSSVIRHTFGFASVAVLLREEGEFVLQASAHYGPAAPLGWRLKLNAVATAILRAQGTVRSAEPKEFCLPYNWIENGIHWEVAVPLLTRDSVYGLLVVGGSREQPFDEIVVSLLIAAAAQLMVALDNANLFAREQAYVQQMTRVNALSVKLTGEQDIDQHLEGILADIATIFGTPRAVLLACPAESQQPAITATFPASASPAAALAGLPPTRAVLEEVEDQRPQFITASDLPDGPLHRIVAASGMQTAMVAPLPINNQTAGLLVLEPPDGGQSWRATDRNLAQTVANLLAQAMENNQLQQQRMQRLRADMIRYMAPQLVDQLLTEGGFGEAAERDVVVLFADLRGFTSLSEKLAPRIVVEQVLNRFFALMTEVLYSHEATIDKFLGDGLMAVFGSLRSRPDDVSQAVRAAIAMQRAYSSLRRDWQQAFHHDIGLGIGMNWGRGVVGNIGSPQRLDYTVIGDVVNTASRLSSIAESSQIVVSQHLVDRLSPAEREFLNPLPAVPLKGKLEQLAIYEVRYEHDQESMINDQ